MKFSKIKLQIIKEQNFDYNSRTIKSSKDIVKYINEYEELDKATQENALVICLNTKNQIVSYTEIGKGGLDSCCLDIQGIFKTALLCNSSKFIIAHNHPSGIAQASKADINVTNRIKEMAKMMDMNFLDHIIIGDNECISCMN